MVYAKVPLWPEGCPVERGGVSQYIFMLYLVRFYDIMPPIRRVVVLGIETHDKRSTFCGTVLTAPTTGWGVANILNKRRNTCHCF